jgi:Fe-S-cluster containining protein
MQSGSSPEGNEAEHNNRHAKFVLRVGDVSSDSELIKIVDAALAENARRSGPWLACRPGCNQCCHGSFEITPLDAERLRRGLADLDQREPARAARVRDRVRAAGLADLADEDYCPALDPESGLCDLYGARPITCRTFGPPVRCDSGVVGVCELCFVGASDDIIRGCIVDPDPDDLESTLIEELAPGGRETTTVARALAVLA